MVAAETAPDVTEVVTEAVTEAYRNSVVIEQLDDEPEVREIAVSTNFLQVEPDSATLRK